MYFRIILIFLYQLKKAENIFIFPFYHTGGAERVHLDILKALKSQNNVILFTGISYNDHFLEEFKALGSVFELKEFSRTMFLYNSFLHVIRTMGGTKGTHYFGCNNYFFYKVLPLLSKWVTKSDLTHAFSYPDLGGTEVYSLNRVPFLDNRFVISEKTKIDFKNLYYENQIPESYLERIGVLRLGVNIDAVDIQPRKHKNPSNKINAIYIGRIAKEKRVHLIIEIGKRLMDLVDLGLYGPKEMEIQDLNVFYKDNINDSKALNRIYQNADVLFITSYREGFPLVIKEAMFHGVICISTNVGSISEHIINGVNGFLVDETNESTIVDNFSHILTELYSNPLLMNKISRRAQKYALENFKAEMFREQIINIFHTNT